MRLINFEFDNFKKMVEEGIISIESITKYKNENRDIALLALFVFSLVLIPEIALLYGLVTMPFQLNGFIFFVLLLVIEMWLFKYGLDFYKLYRDPAAFFWPYLQKKYVKLALIGTKVISGNEHVCLHFITDDRYALTKCNIYVRVCIPKDVYTKAMDLLRKIDNMTFDKDGKKKAVDVEKIVKGVDEDILLLARLLRILIYLYREDISKMGEVYQSVKRQRTYK